jgi:hypothetical protein
MRNLQAVEHVAALADRRLGRPGLETRPMDFHPAPEEKLKPMLEVEIVASNSEVIWCPEGNLDATTVSTLEESSTCPW